MANIDERLLAGAGADKKRQEEMSRSDQLRQEQMAAKDRERQGEVGQVDGQSGSFRERWRAAKRAMDLKQKAKDKLEEKVTAPARAATSKLLQQAWINLIDSFGLTLIWINIHVFLRFVLGEKLFCKLGDEWIPKQVSGAGGEAGKGLSKSIGIVEVMGLAMLDLLVMFVIFGTLGLIAMIVDFMQAGFIEKVEMFIGGLTKLSWRTIKTLYSIFAK